MMHGFLQRFHRGQPLGEVLNTKNLRRIFNVLEGLTGENFAIEKPLDRDGLGWRIVFRPGYSDEEGGEVSVPPKLPLDIVDRAKGAPASSGDPEFCLYQMPTTAEVSLSQTLEIRDAAVTEFVFLNLTKAAAQLSSGKAGTIHIPVAALKRVNGRLRRIIQLFHGNGAQFRRRVLEARTLSLDRSHYRGYAPILRFWHNEEYVTVLPDNQPPPASALIAIRYRVPLVEGQQTRETNPSKVHHIPAPDLIDKLAEASRETIINSFLIDPDEETRRAMEALFFRVLAALYQNVFPQGGARSPLVSNFGVVTGHWWGGWVGFSAEGLTENGAIKKDALNTVEAETAALEAKMGGEPFSGYPAYFTRATSETAHSNAARDTARAGVEAAGDGDTRINDAIANGNALSTRVDALKGAAGVAEERISALEARA